MMIDDSAHTADKPVNQRPNISSFARHILIAVGVVAAVVLLILLIIATYNAFLLLFAAVLVAIFLHGIADWASRYARLPRKLSVILITLLLFGLSLFFTWFLSARLIDQFSQLIAQLSKAIQNLQDSLGKTDIGRTLLKAVPQPEDLAQATASFLQQAAGIFSTTLGVITGLAIIFIIGFYLALDPALYVNGFLRLFPFHQRERARYVFHAISFVLEWWLIGRIFSMITLGLMTGLGLWALGIPLALALGILVGVLTFIPYIGSILSFIPIVLLALGQGLHQALYVFILYMGIQTVESYFLTPMVEKKAVALPPSLTLFVQILTGALFGILGVILASPLTAAAMVVVKSLYIKDILGDDIADTVSKETDTKVVDRAARSD